MSTSQRQPTLSQLTDAALLRRRVCDVAARPLGAMVAAQTRGLYDDLRAVGLRQFKPAVYFGDEWFSPEGVAAIAVPFYLAHPRLARLERHYMREVEGGGPIECRMLLRHEAGHCFDHAYNVSRDATWKRLFGARRRRYDPDAFLPDPTRTHEFVSHLPGSYAQSHPDEDFAETFAVCITPGLSWRRSYRNRPQALAKLMHVASLIENYADVLPQGDHSSRDYAAARMRMTMERFYERRLDTQRRAAARVKRLTHVATSAY